MELVFLKAHELLEKLRNKETTAQELESALLQRIQKVDSQVKAYVRLNQTKSVILHPCLSDVGEGRRPFTFHPSLQGLPIAIKDNICTDGLHTECCSKILEGFKPPYDATVIKKLKDAGANIQNTKTNMDEFAFGSSTENSFFGPTHNPWNLECVPGGSSGGSAAAVASQEAVWALGSDTGGSIRQPASFCGVVGLKPSYGRVSRFGLIAFASSLDQIGPITKDVRDCAILMNIIAGPDSYDATSVDIPVPDYTQSLGSKIKGLRVGIPKEYFVQGLNSEVRTSVDEAIEVLRKLGASCSEVSLPHTEFAVAVYYIVATAEASSNLARFDGVQYGYRTSEKAANLIEMYKKTRGEAFGPEAKRRILLGTFALSHGYYDAYYLRALKVRTLIKNDFDKVFKDCDCIVTPTSPTPAFKIGERFEDPLKMYLSDIYTISANLAGIPGISVPCGFTKNNLPVGLQILGKPFDEETLFKVSYAYEQATPWHTMKPKL